MTPEGAEDPWVWARRPSPATIKETVYYYFAKGTLTEQCKNLKLKKLMTSRPQERPNHSIPLGRLVLIIKKMVVWETHDTGADPPGLPRPL